MKRIAVMVSGGGTNLQAIIDNVSSGEIKAELALVISLSLIHISEPTRRS